MQEIAHTVTPEEMLRCAEIGEECSFFRNGTQYTLFGWGQCDGVFLNIADEAGNIIWQALGRSRAECAAKLSESFHEPDSFLR